MITVKQLIVKLSEIGLRNPNSIVLLPTSDHGYRDDFRVTNMTALHSSSGDWTEDYGEKTTPEAEFGTRTNVVVIQ